jgi:dTDP-4-dehydrorhamnose reductase
MKILILGKDGWLGGMFFNYLKKIGIDVIHCHHDINSIQKLTPDITHVVNFAASTDIDWCEKNKNRTFWNNVLGAVNVAKACKMSNVKYVFISSACIFTSKDENDIKYEDSKPSPGCFYTETKLMAERLIREIDPDTLIVRLRLPISEVSHPRNTLNKLINYKKLIDCQETFTVVEDFIERLTELIKKEEKGTFNLINEGTISPAEIGDLIGHKFERFTKEDLDKQMALEGKANRVSTIVGTRGNYLPSIKKRVADIIGKWKLTLEN